MYLYGFIRVGIDFRVVGYENEKVSVTYNISL
jgi:hypothetical protein